MLTYYEHKVNFKLTDLIQLLESLLVKRLLTSVFIFHNYNLTSSFIFNFLS